LQFLQENLQKRAFYAPFMLFLKVFCVLPEGKRCVCAVCVFLSKNPRTALLSRFL